ncbi:hypothetical protein CQ018_07280 [Arthrobacter sp. MYb227]|nr:hypothetical protein CQ018_07280 [Arthrobacter sp. MYb227]
MDTVALVHYQRDARAHAVALELAAQLHKYEIRSQIGDVTHSSAHELIYFDALVLIGPLHFSRMHGLALIKAAFGFRPVALLLTGATDTDRVLRLLPKHMRTGVPVFTVGPEEVVSPGIDALVTWLRSMLGAGGYRSVS